MSWIKAINEIGGSVDFVDRVDPEVVIISLEAALDMQNHIKGVSELVLALRKDRIRKQIKLFKKQYKLNTTT
jgi:mannitol/fructose-specific phosphotransferase system IIA component (Ntr-type)